MSVRPWMDTRAESLTVEVSPAGQEAGGSVTQEGPSFRKTDQAYGPAQDHTLIQLQQSHVAPGGQQLSFTIVI